jgi:hypothetical protein
LGLNAEVHLADGVFPDAPVTAGDIATINLHSDFEVGSNMDDRWTFHVDGTASTVDVRIDGEPADSIVSTLSTAQFSIDPIAAPVGTTIGQIVFDRIQPLTTKEAELGATISVALLQDSAVVLMLGPVSPRRGFPLDVGHFYEIVASYGLRVPAGMDPPFLVELGATIVSEPSTFALTIVALLRAPVVARPRTFDAAANEIRGLP